MNKSKAGRAVGRKGERDREGEGRGGMEEGDGEMGLKGKERMTRTAGFSSRRERRPLVAKGGHTCGLGKGEFSALRLQRPEFRTQEEVPSSQRGLRQPL